MMAKQNTKEAPTNIEVEPDMMEQVEIIYEDPNRYIANCFKYCNVD